MLMFIIPISLYNNSVHLLQYLFPDAGVEKSSENDKTKAAHSNASVTAAQQGNSDDVCVRFFFDHMNTHAVILQSQWPRLLKETLHWFVYTEEMFATMQITSFFLVSSSHTL